MSPAPDEIARIEHELDILRSRYAIFQRWAKIAKWFFIGLAMTLLLALVGYGTVYDPLAAVIVSMIFLMIGGGLYLTGNVTGRDRWIDIAAPGPAYGRQSEATAIETMIADREKRLAEIKARPA
jgi:hypothetical protein